MTLTQFCEFKRGERCLGDLFVARMPENGINGLIFIELVTVKEGISLKVSDHDYN